MINDYGGEHPLYILHDVYEQVGKVTTRTLPQFAVMKDYPFENQGFFGGHSANPTLPNDTATITDVMARTNPSKPEVSLPILIGELKDIPAMLLAKGKRFIDGAPNSSAVNYNFGWAPLISDLKKMADFTAHVDKRLNELRGLHSQKGLSRSRNVFSERFLGQGSPTTFQSAWGYSAGGYVTTDHKARKWGSVRWIPNVPFKGTDGELASLARHLVHGWDISPGAVAATIWELLPWSWFIDYFSNVGDYLSSNRNGANAIASMGCVMTHRVTMREQIITSSSSNGIFTPGRHRVEEKTRSQATAGITATIPFLSVGQLVTMSSLAQSLRRG
jgi:hypothetical protein